MNKKVIVIGGANVDVTSFTRSEIGSGDAYPGKVELSLGGVSRNIAENLSRLGLDTSLITSLGTDGFGTMVKNNCLSLGIDLSLSNLEAKRTGVFSSVLDKKNDMYLAIADQKAVEELDEEFFKDKIEQINQADLVFISTELSESTLDYLTKNITTTMVTDVVSGAKSKRIKEFYERFDVIKMNEIEAEIFFDEKVTEENYERILGETKDVNLIITRGSRSLFYKWDNKIGISEIKIVDAQNTNGAGDAFISGVIYSYLNNFDLTKILEFAKSCSTLTIADERTNTDLMSVEKIMELINE